jgi:hypothetical protein
MFTAAALEVGQVSVWFFSDTSTTDISFSLQKVEEKQLEVVCTMPMKVTMAAKTDAGVNSYKRFREWAEQGMKHIL